MRIILVIFCIIFSSNIFAQKNNILSIHHFWNDQKIVLDENYFLQNKESISIKTLKYYI